MPINLLSVALNWFATHLVIFSLLGFLVAGLLVFGVIDTSGPGGTRHSEPVSRNKTPDRDTETYAVVPSGAPEIGREHSAAVNRPQARALLDDSGSADGTTAPPEAARPGPRLIGGNLPVYGQPGVADGAFRPPGETPGAVELTRDDLLQHARRAFWNGEFETAESAYMALISVYPDDADAFGELGNLYQSMGRSDRSLDAYYEAAVRLKAAGENEKLNEIIELLEREGDERVGRLNP